MFCVSICLRSVVFLVSLSLPLIFSSNAFADYATKLQQGQYLQDDSGDITVAAYSVPLVYDWNGDGKRDLLIGQNNGGNGYITYYENIGRDLKPVFSAPSYIQSCSPSCSPLNVTGQG